MMVCFTLSNARRKNIRETYAIVTKYIGPGCVQGSRVSARTKDERTIIEWNPALSSKLNHVRAARALARKLGWHGTYLGAMLPNGERVFMWEYVDLRFDAG
jgi:hypothetical protein